MKFYLPYETDPPGIDTTWEQARRQGNAYAAYLNTVRERLPAPLRYITEKINFGDYLLEELDVDLPVATVSLRIMGETITYLSEEKTFLLRFSGVTRCAVTNAGPPGSFLAHSLEGANHEVEVIEPDMFEFRLLFHGGAEIAVRFREFAYEVIPDSNGSTGISPELAEQVADIVTEARTGKLDENVLRELMTRCAVGGSQVHYNLGRLAMDGGYYSLAVEQFTLAAEAVPDHTPTRFLLAKTKFLAHDYPGALHLIEEILREIPNHPGALLYRVRLFGVMERWDELSAFCTDDVLTVSGEVRLWQALALANTNRMDEARSVYQSISKPIRNKNPALNKRVLSLVG